MSTDDPQHPPVPPVSRRSQPRFRSRERRAELAEAFTRTGADYDRLRPAYPEAALDAILAALPAAVERRTAVDLGAGTGKLSAALAARGLVVTAVDPAASMLDALRDPGVERVVGTAEATGLPDACADLVTAAQAWHWFEADAASAEVLRLLRPGGVLALLWNTLDVQIPWVHRYSRIMHAGDVQRDDFAPPVAGGLALAERVVVRWEDPMATPDLVDLARTRSYVITAEEERREKVLANLDWYVHEHLGHERGSTVGLPYRTDLFLYRAA
ncbi:class I SAM-dependent methyltransferase [Brachybacterium rhamnosum]|uniref:Class I SAM-dependent methyltransferase n=1 Tax=Brachybacterium rhamnosum TaxID=173361 RepID=A0ABW4PZW7_9MICO|nr:class I SAM-dependent methyltransferase [Brachybacterium sp. SGAir0954]QCR53024.1 SAM-dependent methyltransferase [Brachybacterium sp. SGAir0954]